MTEWAIRFFVWGGYWAVFALMCLENVVPPIPSELIMGLGGIAVARGDMDFVPLVIAGTLGTVAGNYFWYVVGRWLGYERLQPFVERWGRWLTLDWNEIERAHRFFERRGQWVVFVFRFMPLFRTMVSLPAGMLRMPHWRFAVWTAAGSAIWNVFLAAAGYGLGTNFHEAEAWIGPAAAVCTGVLLLWYVWRVVTWKPKTPRD